MRYKLIVEYDGTGFCGWQHQPGQRSVQSTLEKAIEQFIKHPVRLQVAGRTDAGVHATGQVAHVDLEKECSPFVIVNAVNAYLGHEAGISVVAAEHVADDWHARFSACKRYYRYWIINRRGFLALNRERAWHVPQTLDIEAMRQAAHLLLGHHDFTSFRASECQAESPMRTLDQLDILQEGDNIFFDVSARSFLHHQVRNMVGTLKWIGEGKWGPEKISDILQSCDRRKAGPTAPAHGLYLTQVDY